MRLLFFPPRHSHRTRPEAAIRRSFGTLTEFDLFRRYFVLDCACNQFCCFFLFSTTLSVVHHMASYLA